MFPSTFRCATLTSIQTESCSLGAMKRLLVIAVASVLFLTGCAAQATDSGSTSSSPAVSGSATPKATSSAKPTAGAQPLENPSSDPAAGSGATNSDGKGDALARTTVAWADYAAGTQADIDAQTAAGDCKSLDSQHGSAIANEAAVRSTSGHGAEALLAYIDEALNIAGCN